jgi:hypothetical protein
MRRLFIVLFLIISCEKGKELDELTADYVCVDNNCDIIFGFKNEDGSNPNSPENSSYILPDNNGYFHIELNWNQRYWPRFMIDVYANKINKGWLINDEPFVSARFSSNKSWIIGDTLVYDVPLYREFGGLSTSSGQILPDTLSTVYLTQFEGIEVNVVQNTSIYFKDIGDYLFSRRLVGPFPPYFVEDTVTIAMEIQWAEKVYKTYQEKFIIHDINKD